MEAIYRTTDGLDPRFKALVRDVEFRPDRWGALAARLNDLYAAYRAADPHRSEAQRADLRMQLWLDAYAFAQSTDAAATALRKDEGALFHVVSMVVEKLDVCPWKPEEFALRFTKRINGEIKDETERYMAFRVGKQNKSILRIAGRTAEALGIDLCVANAARIAAAIDPAKGIRADRLLRALSRAAPPIGSTAKDANGEVYDPMDRLARTDADQEEELLRRESQNGTGDAVRRALDRVSRNARSTPAMADAYRLLAAGMMREAQDDGGGKLRDEWIARTTGLSNGRISQMRSDLERAVLESQLEDFAADAGDDPRPRVDEAVRRLASRADDRTAHALSVLGLDVRAYLRRLDRSKGSASRNGLRLASPETVTGIVNVRLAKASLAPRFGEAEIARLSKTLALEILVPHLHQVLAGMPNPGRGGRP